MIKLLKNLSYKEWILVVISIGLVVLQVYLDITMPEYTSTITSLIYSKSEIKEVIIAGLKMMGFAFGSLLTSISVAIISSKISANFAFTLREKLFKKVDTFSLNEINKFSTASLITRTTNDVTQVQNLIVMGLQAMIKAPIMAVWAIIKISNKQIEWTLAVLISVIILIIAAIITISIVLPKFKKIQTMQDALNRVSRENLSGLSVVRAFNAEEFELDRFYKANENLTKANYFTQNSFAFLSPIIQAIFSGLTLAIYWIGAILLNNASLSDKANLFGDMMVFSQWGIQIVISFMLLAMIFVIFPRAQVSANRINEVLNSNPSIRDGNLDKGIDGLIGEIEFDNVSFSYNSEENMIVKNISFKANRGETVALIGSTGCGKSTIVNLIPRFYDVNEGEVLIDGINVKDYKLSALREKIGFIEQKSTLFSGTIKSNIGLGNKKISDIEALENLKIAQGENILTSKDEGINSPVSQSGRNYSGGQKQRISIARALAKNPEILIFDDSFSALDYKTDRLLRDELKIRLKDTTKIIVAQRIGTIIDADQIIVIEDGEIAGKGTHKELLKNCDVYRQIALSQLSKEELDNAA